MTRGLIFDYGGTLDTCGRHWGKVLWSAYRKEGVGVTEEQFREAYVHAERTLGRNPIVQPDFTFKKTLDTKLGMELGHLADKGYLNAGEKEQETMRKDMLNSLYEDVKRVTSHSISVLGKLSKSYPMVLVSNFYGNIGVVLREFGFDGLFKDVIESAVVGVRKPDPRIFTLGVEALGLKSEDVAVVGDSFDKDILPAKAAGCRTVWIKGEGWTDAQPDESKADRVITDLGELLQGGNTIL